MGFIDVTIKRTAAITPPPFGYISWLEYWEITKGKKANTCEVLTCTELPVDVGWIVTRKSECEHYIIPMCKACSNKPEGEIFKTWENHMMRVTHHEQKNK